MDLVVTEIPKKVPKICLNMIVKDESHIIEDTLTKLLNKVKIDYWVISDTGSTDKTKETIVEFFRKKNIKGELFEDKWENFGYNRTKALEHAYKKSEYVLIFDADDEICGDFIVPELKYDLYNFQFGSPNGVSYIRPQLVNNNKIWKYKGVLHEFITCIENNHTSAIITGNYYTVSGRTSNRNKDSNKYLKDALILEKAYEDAVKNGDEIYSRYGFYCANSYYDCGKHEEAIKWFKITLANKNWEQEKYVSCLRLYKCYNSLNQKETGMFYLIKAFSYDKERVECLYELVLHYCLDGMNDVAYSYYNIVKSFHNDKYLKRDLVGKLFVDVGIAELYLPYYMILVSDKVGDHETTIQMYRIIFTKKFIESNKFFIGNMLYNLQFFIERVKDDKTFINLFNEYINFLISIDYPIHDHEFMNLYEKYGVVLPKISNQIFSNEVCMESKNILFYTGYSPIKWNHTYGSNNALGGSETAIISLSSNFPKEYKVYISGDVEEETVDNITYINMNNLHNLIKMTAFHTIIVSRYLNFYEIYKNFSAYQTFIWGHDIALFPYGTNLSVESILQKWSSKITGCICQTEWHKNLFISTYPQLNNKITVINNGVNNNMFTQHTRKVNNRFIYTSCTERGLDRLLEIWPLLTKEIPDAELFISSYNNFPINSNEVVLKNIIDSYPNVEHLGKLNKNDLYELMSTAEYWLYPTNFNETSCITAMEMLMSEVICIYYPIAGLVYTLGDYGIPVQRGNEIETILELTTKNKNEIKKRGKEYAISCSWENRANNWIKLINIENKKNQVVFDSNKYSTVTESNSINKNINLSNEEKRIFELYETISMPESHNRILKNISKTFTPKVIYDIGASTLHWTKEVKKIWNDVEIIAFDAIQEAEELYKSQNVKYNIGVLSDQDNKVVNFYENKENPAGNSYYREIGHPNSINIYPENSYKEKVSKTLTTVVKERLFSLPELIKIDVQGAELDILKGGHEIISNAKYLIIELQNIEYNKGAPLANITIDFLIENGWEIVESKFSDNGPDADYLFVNTNYDSIMKNKINIDNTKLDMWKNLNIEPYYNFPVSKNWFGYSEIKKYLLNNIDLTKQYNILEIGSFEGCSSCFFSDILINNSLSTLTCVDPFVSDGCTKTDHSTLKYKFYSNIKKTENYNKINVVEKISDDFYSTYNGSKFNFIYIDGEHSDKQILKDLDACFSLLDINGIIWCDDYNNNWKHTFDSWILLKNDYINIIHSGYQLGFIKIKETKIQKNTINNTEIVNNTGIINSGNDNDINYTIKVINLERRSDRKTYMINKLNEKMVNNYEFFKAVDGNLLEPSIFIKNLFKNNDFNYRKGIIGCALSHYELWNNLINDNKYSYYVILEDDIELVDNFNEYLDKCIYIIKEQNIKYCLIGGYQIKDKLTINDTIQLDKITTPICSGTFGYIISNEGCKTLVNYLNKHGINRAIDHSDLYTNCLDMYKINKYIVNAESLQLHGKNDTDIQFNYDYLKLENIPTYTVSFVDWWTEEYCGGIFDNDNNYFTKLLRDYYNVQIVEPNQNPDILFYSVFGNDHLNLNAGRKIFYSGESISQDNIADFNITFDENSEKNCRLPLWVCYLNDDIIDDYTNKIQNKIEVPQKSKFCSIISQQDNVSNKRSEIVNKLSKYKRVDCGGKFMNNIGYVVPRGINCSEKIEYNNNYKFSITFENKNYPGYVTEKICDAYKSKCIPIYWGTSDVVKDFNKSTFINANDFVSIDELVEYIIKVDNNDELYASYFKEPIFSNKWLDTFNDKNKTFYKNLTDCIIGKNTNLLNEYFNEINNNKNKQDEPINYNRINDNFRNYIFEYGIDSNKKDVTDIIVNILESTMQNFVIPIGDNMRAQLFGDPCWGHVKNIFIYNKNYPEQTIIVTENESKIIYFDEKYNYNFVMGFYDNGLSERGTTTALYSYADYAEKYFNCKSIIFYNKHHHSNNNEVINRFSNRFDVYRVENFEEIDKIIYNNNIKYLYNICGGLPNSTQLVKNCKNLIHAVFNIQQFGDIYAGISDYIVKKSNFPNLEAVPHMIDLPIHNDNMRKELDLPDNAFVIGRIGGYEQFDIKEAHIAIINFLNNANNNDTYFVFVNTAKFYEHPQIIYLDKITDTYLKVKYINTCNCMIHARSDGETFGLAIGEFSSLNKPVITCRSDKDNCHLDILGEKAIIFDSETSLINILKDIKSIVKSRDHWNAYKEYTPDKVMKKFHKVFLPNEDFINSCNNITFDNITFDNINYIDMKSKAPHFHNTKELVIVSAFLDINREKWSTYKRTTRDYILSFINYFNYNTKMLVFIDDRYIEELKEIYNNSVHNNTIFIPINNDWMTKHIYAWQQLEVVKEIMESDYYRNLVKDRIACGNPENIYADYNAINHSKIDFICYAINNNLINRDAFICWSDFGYFNSILHNNPSEYPINHLDITKFNPNKLSFCLRNKLDNKDQDAIYTLVNAPERFTGSFFAGSATLMIKLQELYHTSLKELYNNNISDDDQPIYLRCFLKEPNIFNLYLDSCQWPKALCYFEKLPDRFELVQTLLANIKNGKFVEIGCDRGSFSKYILTVNKTSTLYSVDPYISYDNYIDSINYVTGDNLYNETNMKLTQEFGDRFKLIREFSNKACNLIPDNLNFVYIDGNHQYKYVYEDLCLWWEKLAPNGIIVGDDAVDTDETKRDKNGNIFIEWCPGSYGKYGVIHAFNRFISEKKCYGQIIGNQFVLFK